MKLFMTFLFASITIISAQDASVYFPPLGSKWDYQNTTLDSLNNPIDSLTFFSSDSFAFQADYQGKFSNAVISKSSQFDAIPADTNYIHFEGAVAWAYMDAFNVADSIPGGDTLGVADFLSSFSAWYSVFRFSEAPGAEYDIVKRDTTFLLDTLAIPIRVHVKGKRLPDETTTTPAGTFACKKFLISPSIGIVLSPVIPPIPLIDMLDTIWIAENRWIVKDISPSAPFSSALFGGPSFYLPGSKMELITLPTGVQQTAILQNFSLDQNYPNPFNPETKIKFVLPEQSNVQIAVFNNSGEQVKLLYQGEKPAGSYEVLFDGKNLASGVYYYRLKTDKFTQTRKMILLK